MTMTMKKNSWHNCSEKNAIDVPECECSVVTLTKDMVDMILAKNERNRKVVKSNLKKLADEFSNGRYCFTGQPIIIDGNGRLLDGQHRLYALRMADYPNVRALLVQLKGDSTEIDNAYDKMDTGVTRRFRVKLQAIGIKNSSRVAAICNKISYLETGYTVWPVNPDSYLMDILKLYNTCPKVGGGVEQNNFIYRMAELMKPGHGFIADMAAACCIVARVTGSYDEIEEFVKRALDGSMLVRGSPEHTINRVFSGVLNRDQKGKNHNSSCFALMVNALVAYFNHETYPIVDRNIKRAITWIEGMAHDNDVFLLPHTIKKEGLNI